MRVYKSYIRYREDIPETENQYAAELGFRQLGRETEPFRGFGDIGSLSDIGPEVCISGYIQDVYDALRKVGRPLPAPMDYPEELMGFLGREVRRTTLRNVTNGPPGVFVKPVAQKVFTGFVWGHSIQDGRRICGVSRDDEEVWASSVVEFVSEYRGFVLERELVGMRHYKGDWSKAPDRSPVEAAVLAFRNCPAAYTLDWGVTSDGRTLLVEANDGFAMGSYGLQPALYARMLAARWEEMVPE